jgi:hypothetical protein|tara:strand:+ start:109 stop:705 length:597 start_codon:yes stop_codon:yes gene_type:complete
MNDSLYNFNEKSDDLEQSIKLNMDELYTKKQQQDMNILNNYNKILVRIHNKIKYVSKQLVNEQCCWYVMPEMMIGIPKYDVKDCTAYVIEKLRDNGFVIRYTHPNLLFISWKHWVPSYVRNEIKKKTGQQVDEYGNLVNKNEENDSRENNNYNNLILNNNNKSKSEKSKNDYKDIKSYNPSGNLIYSNNLLKKLDINN